ncbi:hypothetical protein FVE85_1122 [Porphyridium purpureum]|uniref:Uncharacterized protein n=1 Tax=Porphyridium purpureum TaxID=35688 RepID=A0A5J4Z384_PORPP|nr:hypothetical protein FVE85_1122 [Porphyridium purpureum]|eukprot:POR4784..scf208_2
MTVSTGLNVNTFNIIKRIFLEIIPAIMLVSFARIVTDVTEWMIRRNGQKKPTLTDHWVSIFVGLGLFTVNGKLVWHNLLILVVAGGLIAIQVVIQDGYNSVPAFEPVTYNYTRFANLATDLDQTAYLKYLLVTPPFIEPNMNRLAANVSVWYECENAGESVQYISNVRVVNETLTADKDRRVTLGPTLRFDDSNSETCKDDARCRNLNLAAIMSVSGIRRDELQAIQFDATSVLTTEGESEDVRCLIANRQLDTCVVNIICMNSNVIYRVVPAFKLSASGNRTEDVYCSQFAINAMTDGDYLVQHRALYTKHDFQGNWTTLLSLAAYSGKYSGRLTPDQIKMHICGAEDFQRAIALYNTWGNDSIRLDTDEILEGSELIGTVATFEVWALTLNLIIVAVGLISCIFVLLKTIRTHKHAEALDELPVEIRDEPSSSASS